MSGRPNSAVSAVRGLYSVPFATAAAEAALNAYLRALADGLATRAQSSEDQPPLPTKGAAINPTASANP
jgi:hypothetical protein